MPTTFREAVTWLLEHEAGALSTWDLDFLDSIEGRASLTPKQQAKLNTLWRDVVGDGASQIRCCGEAEGAEKRRE